jgi:phytoene/squalene synthetase
MINLQRAWRVMSVPQSDRHRAERFNRDMAKREAGNFYWGFISLGYHERMAIYALYNFARQVDDEADTVGLENLPARLAVHRERVTRAARGDYGDDPILRVLAEAIER